MNKFTQFSTLILLSSALGGCPSASKLLESKIGGTGDSVANSSSTGGSSTGTSTGGTSTGGTSTGGTSTGGASTGGTSTGGTSTGGTSTGGGTGGTTTGNASGGGAAVAPSGLAAANAVGRTIAFSCDGSADIDRCGDTFKPDQTQGKGKSADVKAIFSNNDEKTSITLDGVAFATDIPLEPNDEAGQTQVTYANPINTATTLGFESGSSNPYDSGDNDEFFFFNIERASISRATGRGSYEYYNGVDGTMAAKEKIKTAKYVGRGDLNVDFWNNDGTDGGAIESAEVTSEINANLDGAAPILNAKLTVTRGYDEVTDMSSTTAPGVGYSVEINNATIDGNKFGGGTMVLKDADGNTAANFNDSVFVGGFYGLDAEFAAGVFDAQGVGVTNHVGKPVWIDGQIWGEKQPVQ